MKNTFTFPAESPGCAEKSEMTNRQNRRPLGVGPSLVICRNKNSGLTATARLRPVQTILAWCKPRQAFLLSIALAIVCAGCKTQMAPTRHGIPNFRWVCMEEGICAGGEPTPAGYDWLLTMEITNVVQLNPGSRPIPDGLSVTRLPVTTWEQIFGGRAMTEKLDAASVLIMMPSTFVHCQHGANRTGAVVLRRRIVIDGWDHRAAMEEADEHGWESSLPALKAYGKKLIQKATQRARRLP